MPSKWNGVGETGIEQIYTIYQTNPYMQQAHTKQKMASVKENNKDK